ncbi:MAG: hypothetical protein HYX91_05915 [Chloroflexi bacterium]|nr:hypothetical protein [Chloroflexota bacterium]
MDEKGELDKLAGIATDMALSVELRIKAIDLIGNIGTREALLVLLNMVANENLSLGERDLAIKRAREILRKGH